LVPSFHSTFHEGFAFVRDQIVKASKGAGEPPHLKCTEWITEMNPNRKKNKKGASYLTTPWGLRIGIFRGPFLVLPSSVFGK